MEPHCVPEGTPEGIPCPPGELGIPFNRAARVKSCVDGVRVCAKAPKAQPATSKQTSPGLINVFMTRISFSPWLKNNTALIIAIGLR
jgi:hypothetical protein